MVLRVAGDTEHVAKLLMDHCKVHMITGDVEAVENKSPFGEATFGEILCEHGANS